ncbi:MAG: Mur ligase family protein [Candidatus Saccharibacteria bacterium]|nr:Mur ligase family protein [Candidatus Saccharibacteria bacterium]
MDSQLMPSVDAFLQNLIAHPPNKGARQDYITAALSLLDNPQDAIPAIHIAGTSGKGSTAYYATHILISAGYSVGTCMSPHITSVTERSLINGLALPPSEYSDIFLRFCNLYKKHRLHFSYFEFLTVFSFWLFHQKKVDYMVIETGIGGRLDATNVITRPDTIRAITDIGLDHTELLGDTLADIATEKAGIIHPENVVVINPQDEVVCDVIATTAAINNARLVINNTRPQFLADIRQRNWQLAQLATTQRLVMDGKNSPAPCSNNPSADLVIPGRCETHTIDNVLVVIDAAHNPQKLQGLTAALTNQYPTKQPLFVVAFGDNKTATLQQSLTIIDSLALFVIATSFTSVGNYHKSIPATSIKANLSTPCSIELSPVAALTMAIQQAKSLNTYVVVTGSFYLISDIYSVVHSWGVE